MAFLPKSNPLVGFAKNQFIKSIPAQNGSLAVGGAQRFSGKLRTMRLRLKSLGASAKITKTLKLIANAKLRDAQIKLNKVRPYILGPKRVLDPIPLDPAPKNNAFVIVCTDRGLCGGVNTGVIKMARILNRERTAKGIKTTFFLMGEKGNSPIQRDLGNKVGFSAMELFKRTPSFEAVSMVADKILHSDKYDQITIFHNHFINIGSYKAEYKDIGTADLYVKNYESQFANYEFEEEEQLFHLEDLSEFYVVSSMWHAMFENSASELAGRVTAMDSASRNAGELMKNLSIKYNRSRQAAITTELIEIISGANAVSAQ